MESRVVGGLMLPPAAFSKGQDYACVFSFPMCVWEQALPTQLEASGGAALVSSPAGTGPL